MYNCGSLVRFDKKKNHYLSLPLENHIPVYTFLPEFNKIVVLTVIGIWTALFCVKYLNGFKHNNIRIIIKKG